jgi:hypothetical protein
MGWRMDGVEPAYHLAASTARTVFLVDASHMSRSKRVLFLTSRCKEHVEVGGVDIGVREDHRHVPRGELR